MGQNNIQQGEVTDLKSLYRGTVVTKTLNIRGVLRTSTITTPYGDVHRRSGYTCYSGSNFEIYTVGSGSHVEYEHSVSNINGTGFYLRHIYGVYRPPTGAGPQRVWLLPPPGCSGSNHYCYIQDVIKNARPPSDYEYTYIDTQSKSITDTFTIDWKETLGPLYTAGGDYVDPSTYTIIGWKWGDVNGEDVYYLDKSAKYIVSSNMAYSNQAVRGSEKINNDANTAYHGAGDRDASTYLDGSRIGLEIAWEKDVSGHPQIECTSTQSYCPHVEISDNETNYSIYHSRKVYFPGEITVFLVLKTSLSNTHYIGVGNTEEMADDDADDPNPDNPNVDDSKIDGSENAEGDPQYTSSSKGSYNNDALNEVKVYYDDLLTTFDSVKMSSGTYSSFVSAGGGVVCESGVFENGDAFYIESIDLGVSGSTMRVVQVAEFDAAASLSIGEKIYGYILSEGDTQPSFSGFVHSISRRLHDNSQEIIYECKDLKGYIDQFITPVVYKNNTDDVNTIASDLLIQAGITSFTNNLPTDVKVPIDYQAASLSQVLDHLCSVAGAYYYWINVNGELVIDQLDNTNHSYAVPTTGTAITSSHKIRSFESLSDLSRSRSRIVVVGGSGYAIKDVEKRVSYISDYSPQTTITSLEDMEGRNGWFFRQVGAGNGYYLAYLAISVAEEDEILDTRTTGAKASVTRTFTDVSSMFWTVYDSTEVLQSKDISYKSSRTLAFNCGVVFWNSTTESWESTLAFPVEHNHYFTIKYAYRDNTDPLIVTLDTGNLGGTYTHQEPNFKKITTPTSSRNDKSLMGVLAAQLAEYYAPIYGGTLTLDGLETSLEIGDTLSITGTDLPSSASTSLKIYSISFDIVSKTTTVQLSTKPDLYGFSVDADILRANREYYERQVTLGNYSILRNNISF